MVFACKGSTPKIVAFTLVEMAIAIVVVGLLATIGVTGIGNVVSASHSQKLQADVATINSAIQSYIASGGSIDNVQSVDDLLMRLKTRTDNSISARIPGLSSSMIDSRVATVMQSDTEALTTEARVVWDAASNQLQILNSGGVGVKEFRLDDDLAEVAGTTGDRTTAMKYSGQSTWIWDYEDVGLPAAPRGPDSFPVNPDVPVSSPTAVPPVPNLPIPKLTLDAPIPSRAAGTYPINEFNLVVSLSNPNPPGVSEVYYALDFGNWNRYVDPLTIGPGVTLSAQAIPNASDWEESGKIDHSYAVIPELLLTPYVLPDKPIFDLTLGSDVTVTLNDANPPGFGTLLYSVNGGSWATYFGPFVLSSGSYPAGATVEAKAVPTSPYYLDSGVAGATIGVAATPPVPLNSPPFAGGNGYSVVYTYTGTTPVINTLVLMNDSDPDGDPLTVVSVTNGAHGTVTIDAAGLPLFTSSPTFIDGKDSFTYTISDGRGGTSTATVTVNVNAKPVAVNDSITTKMNTPVIGNVLTNDWDHGGDPLIVEANLNPANGTVTINADGNFSYTPNAGFIGSDSFRYTVADQEQGRTYGFVNISVTPSLMTSLLDADSDTSFAATVPDWSGVTDQLYCNGLDPAQTVVRFDLAGKVAGPAKIKSATLHLTRTAGSDGVFFAHQILPGAGAWWTSGITWNSSGKGLQTNDVELVAAAEDDATVTTVIPGVPGWSYRNMYDITALVQRWVDSPASNYGVALLGAPGQRIIYCSREHPLDVVRPKLVIEWESK